MDSQEECPVRSYIWELGAKSGIQAGTRDRGVVSSEIDTGALGTSENTWGDSSV